MNIHEAFPSPYLHARDLGEKQPLVVIRIVEARTMRVEGGKQVKKLVVHFVGKAKALVLNKTVARAIAALVGSEETTAWAGKTIRLYATTTTFGKDTVPCVRVKAPDVGGRREDDGGL
jgi:hypothetical protein